MENIYNKMIKEICEENNIQYNLLSKGWITMLEKDNKTRFISGYKFDLNLHGIGMVIDDKYALYDVLKAKNIPVIEHHILYNRTNKSEYSQGSNTYEYVKDIFLKNNNNIVIKPNNGACGENVLNVTDINEIDNILEKLLLSNFSISICPFYSIKREYRVIMLDGKIKLIYAKSLPEVTGDGTKTIKQLLIEFNPTFFSNKLEDAKYDKILPNGEKYKYNWKFNLSQGAIAKKVQDNILIEKLSSIANDVYKAININFGSIDIIETTNNEFMVLEANSGVMIKNYIKQNPDEYNTAKEIYNEAIQSLFK